MTESKDDKQKSAEKKPAAKAEAKAKPAAKAAAGADKYMMAASSPWAGAWKIAAGVGGVGLAGGIAGYFADPKRFAFSYLFAFMAVLTVALGMLFFVLIQHLTSAGWSVTVRRTAEFFSVGLVAMAVLFLPVYATRGQLFPWLHPHHAEAGETHTTSALLQAPAAEEHAAEPKAAEPKAAEGAKAEGAEAAKAEEPKGHAEERIAGAKEKASPEELEEIETMEKKSGYLNDGFFSVRAVVYLVAWALIAWQLFRWSTDQDKSKDPKLTVKMQRFAPPVTYVFGFTLTFAAFDWIMSLEPSWFSTIFGVYVFAGGVVSSYATLILVTMALRDSGMLQKEINVEHYHDMGKLMFGFLVFWAYIGFSQFMLIWYAAIPEELTFFHNRWDNGPWKMLSLALIICNFVVPFFLVVSRNAKRKLSVLRFGALWLLVMHVVDIYWLVMPNYGQAGFTVHWLDLVCLLGVGGVYMAVVLHHMKRFPLIPVGDPRLPRALHFENA